MRQPTLSQDTVDDAAWATCDIFRGGFDASIYKDYVLTMLFLKYVSDAWHDQRAHYRDAYGDAAPGLVDALMANERFVLPPEASFEALHAARLEPGNGERIDQALHQVEAANPAKLRDVFQDISFNAGRLGGERQKNELLQRLLEAFSQPALDLSPSRLEAPEFAGHAFEHVIKNFASATGKQAAEFYTPPEMSDLMVRLVDPKQDDDICDPVCGSGSLLVRCARHIRKGGGARRYALFGQESIGSTWALAKMNMYLHGEDNHRIEWGDTLRDPRLLLPDMSLRQFDVQVANPPFSLDKWGHETADVDPFGRFKRGPPPRTKGDYAFILHMIECMKPGAGRMAVIAPHGVLFRGGTEAQIREKLVRENLLDAVIGLPEKLFYGTGISAVLLVFRHGRADDRVLFVDASRGFDGTRNQNVLRRRDIDDVVGTYQARVAVDRYAELASSREIEKNGFNLNISRYIDRFRQHQRVDIGALQREREDLQRERAEIEAALAGHLTDLVRGP